MDQAGLVAVAPGSRRTRGPAAPTPLAADAAPPPDPEALLGAPLGGGRRAPGRGLRRGLRRRWRTHPLASLVEIGTLATLTALGAALLAGIAVDRAYQDRVLPGVRFGALPLHGLGRAQVQGLLEAHTNTFLAAPITFVYGDREWRPPAAEVGLALDTAGMARDALRLGRETGWLARGAQPALSAALRPHLELRAGVDRTQLTAFLGAVALEIDRQPVNAGLSVRNGELVVGQAAPGRQVDVGATLQRVQAPRSLEPQRVEVVVRTIAPSVGDEGLREAQAAAARILSGPLILQAGARAWTLSPAALGAMLDVKRVPDPEGAPGREVLAAALNEARVAAYVRTIAAQIDKPATDAQFRWTGSGVTVVRESADGVKLDQPPAVRAIVAQAGTDNREVALALVTSRPAVSSDNASQLGIRELVASGGSRFAGSSPERANNIRVAAGRLNGVVIPAGGTFSFLSALGPITKENGYQEGLTIQGDATVPGIGGGVCQVSTTMFRAAFYAGLPIVERHQHTYRVGYYEQDGSPVGFDAAVYDPGVDLRFRNDTGAAILIQAGVDPGSSTLAFRFYGTSTGREVKLGSSKANEVKAGPRLPDGSDPQVPQGVRKQVEWAADGVDATIRRTVLQGGQALLSDAFFSRYVPWREKWVVGTGPAA